MRKVGRARVKATSEGKMVDENAMVMVVMSDNRSLRKVGYGINDVEVEEITALCESFIECLNVIDMTNISPTDMQRSDLRNSNAMQKVQYCAAKPAR
jgi:hypothetical protein